MEENLNLAGHFGGVLNCVRVQENILVCNFGPELAIFDITIPEKLRRIGYTLLEGVVQDIYLSNNYVYVAVSIGDDWSTGGVHIIDLRIWERPTKIGYLAVPSYLKGIEFDGMYLYLAVQDEALVAVNVANPAAPFIVADKPAPGYRWLVTAADNRINLHPVEIVFSDVSQASRPQLICDYGIHAIIRGSYAYVATTGTFTILDISNPMQPLAVGTCQPDNWGDLVEDLDIQDRFAWIIGDDEGGQGKLRLFDVSTPTAPRQLAVFPLAGRSITIKDHYLYLASAYQGGLSVWDIAEPARPQLLSRYLAPTKLTRAVLAKQLLYAVAGEGFYVVNLENVANPAGIGFFASKRVVAGLDVKDTIAYLAEGPTLEDHIAHDGMGGGLRILDISDPENPKSISFLDLSEAGHSEDVVVHDEKAYLLWHTFNYKTHTSSKYILKIDVTDPSTPRLIGEHLVSLEPGEVTLNGIRFYVGNWWLSHIKEEADRSAWPSEDLVSINCEQGPVQIGNLIFRADGLSGLSIWKAGSL